MFVKEKYFGERIYFRSLTDADATRDYCMWLNDSQVNEFLETRTATIESLKEYISEKNAKKDCIFFGIFDRKTDMHIGNIKLEPITRDEATFSIMIGNKNYWGLGIGSEATSLMVKYGFEKLGVKSINLGVINLNKRAIHVYEKVGFKIRSVEKGAIIHDCAKFDKVNMVIMGAKAMKNELNICSIIQARMDSTRLPGKVMMKIKDKPLLYYDIDQVRASKLINKVIVATTTSPHDDVIEKAVNAIGFDVYRGSENDVLDRYYQTAKKFNVDVIVRITSDCPLIDPVVIDEVIQKFLDTQCDYCSNVQPPTYPDGLDVEVFSFAALERAWKEAKLMSEREHVTPYLWKNTDKFKIEKVVNDKDLNRYRLTVDQKEDFDLVALIYAKIRKRPILLNDLMELFKKEPELIQINAKYTRNEGYAKSVKEDKLIQTHKKLFVTGGAGFIGSNFIKFALAKGHSVINYDLLTYAGNLDNLKDIKSNNYTFVKGNIMDFDKVLSSIGDSEVIVNFAAESHVDRSISDPNNFVLTNIIGTATLLEVARKKNLSFVQISTDEVYGSLEKDDEPSIETHILKPRSPYSSSKSAAEHLAMSYHTTYGLNVMVTRSSNNFGPNQHPEKLIPRFITNLILGEKVPLMGKGDNIRDWIYVEDNCDAILTVIDRGKAGEIYNIGGGNDKTNLEITKIILAAFGKDNSWIREIPHRLGHDFRYALHSGKIHGLGWKPKHSFDEGMRLTIDWYKNNTDWWKKLKEEKK
jgi:dTDP-glucose 4,6-dehydratase